MIKDVGLLRAEKKEEQEQGRSVMLDHSVTKTMCLSIPII